MSMGWLLVAQLISIWREEVWVSWPKSWDIILSIVDASDFLAYFIDFLIPLNSAGIFLKVYC